MVSEPFKGTINVDIRDSVPDWTPFEPPRAPDGAPNVVYIVLDDVGYSAMNCYGGPIETPNIDRIANSGTIKRAAIDVSGQPYLDLERQAEAMLARE